MQVLDLTTDYHSRTVHARLHLHKTWYHPRSSKKLAAARG